MRTCLAEIRSHNGWIIAVGRFKVTTPMTLFDFRVLDSLSFPRDIFEDNYAERVEWIGILRGLSSELSTPTWPTDDTTTYVAPQYLAAYVVRNAVPHDDGIIYSSTQAPGARFNVALFGGRELGQGDTPALALDPPEPLWARSTSINIDWAQTDVARPVSAGGASQFPATTFELSDED